MTIKKLNRHKSTGIDEIPAEFTKAWGRTIRSEINKLINCSWNKEKLPEEWKESIVLPIYMSRDKTNFSNYTCISLLLNMYNIFFQHPAFKFKSECRRNFWYHQCEFRRNMSSTGNIILPSLNI
jgi:hypothetical protein